MPEPLSPKPMPMSPEGQRCCAVVGTVHTGPMYCGHPANLFDPNMRPICGVHRRGNPAIPWRYHLAAYPNGTRGRWEWKNGAPRA